MENNNNPFEETINTLNQNVEEIDKTTREEDQNNDSEEKNTNPGYVLYNAIASNSIELLKNDTVVNTFKKLAGVVGEDVSKDVVEMFAILMSQSAYQSILFYDAMLKQELDKQFNHFAEHINSQGAVIDAHNSVITVFKKHLDDIQTKLNLEDFEKTNHITSD